MITIAPLPFDEALLARFDVPGPRYTSYPTSDRFVEAFGEPEYKQAVGKRNIGGMSSALSLYIHVPFCASLCYYCACNKIVTKRYERGDEYVNYLIQEIEMNAALLGKKQPVTQIHFGGGTPTFLNDSQLTEIMTALKQHFGLAEGGEVSIEIDPRTVDESRLKVLFAMGFNRISFGVQDFDPEVQKAVHRIQPAEEVFEIVEASRRIGFQSINVDLIYGLPKQTSASFARTLGQVAKLRPDRIALYAYAHLPERFKPQRRIHDADLPKADEKVGMLSAAISAFLSAGYAYIGMDHFALPTDSLAIAKRKGMLHRNFQGYSTFADCDLIGLGVSAISKIGGSYSQNAKTLEEYYDHLTMKRFPTVRGMALSHDDLVRRTVIMALMCQGALQYESVELAYFIDFRTYFAQELEALSKLEVNGLVEINDKGIEVTAKGWFFIRAIAMTFDRYLQTDSSRARFSKIL